MSNKRTCVCGVTYNIGPNANGGYSPYSCKCVGSKPQGKVTHYVTYSKDVPYRSSDGIIQLDANGNILLQHREGDKILDADGNPIVKLPDADYLYTGRKSDRPDDNGLVVKLPSCGRTHIDNLGYMGDEAFDVVFRAVAEEKMRRTAGGKPLNYFAEASISPIVVAKL